MSIERTNYNLSREPAGRCNYLNLSWFDDNLGSRFSWITTVSLMTEILSLFVFSSTLYVVIIEPLGLDGVPRVQSAHFSAASDWLGRHAVRPVTKERDLRERWPFISIRLAGVSLASMITAARGLWTWIRQLQAVRHPSVATTRGCTSAPDVWWCP